MLKGYRYSEINDKIVIYYLDEYVTSANEISEPLKYMFLKQVIDSENIKKL